MLSRRSLIGLTLGAEFDFQAGDIIAVTSTPEDGWWSGELLDEARRIPGRNDFPSNLWVSLAIVLRQARADEWVQCLLVLRDRLSGSFDDIKYK